MKTELKLVIALGIIFSLIIGLPHLYFIYKNGYKIYNPISLKNVNPLTLDENLYSSNIQEVINGNFLLSNAQLTNRSNLPSAQIDYLNYYFLGLLGFIVGSSIKNVHLISDFIFPFILFILFYIFLRKLNFRKKIILIITSVIMLFSLNPFVWLGLVNSFLLNQIVRPLEFSRLISPEFVLIFLLISLIMLYQAITKKETKYFILAGLMGGLLAYIYFIYFTFFWSGLFFLAVITLIEKDYLSIKQFILMIIIGITTSIFFIINFFKLKSLSYYPEIALRIGAEFPNLFSFWHIIFTLIILSSIACLWWTYKYTKRLGQNELYKVPITYLTSFLLGSIICINLHLFTGYTILYLHWWERIVVFIVFISYALFFQFLVYDLYPNKFLLIIVRKAMMFIFILLLVIGIYTQVSFSINKYKDYKISNEELELYGWLKNNTPKDSTILTLSIITNFNLASQTHNNIYLPHSYLTTIPKEEIIDRFLFVTNLFNLPKEEIEKRLNSDNLMTDEYDLKVSQLKETSSELQEIAFFNYYFFHEEYAYHHYKLEYYPSELPKNYTGYYLPNELKTKIMNKFINKDYQNYSYDYVLVGPYEKNSG